MIVGTEAGELRVYGRFLRPRLAVADADLHEGRPENCERGEKRWM